jgi:hypothetical protein
MSQINTKYSNYSNNTHDAHCCKFQILTATLRNATYTHHPKAKAAQKAAFAFGQVVEKTKHRKNGPAAVFPCLGSEQRMHFLSVAIASCSYFNYPFKAD